MLRPSISRGWPALGCAESFTCATLRHPLERLEHRRGPDAAVQADDVGAARFELGHERLGRRAVEAVAVLFGGHLRDDRQVADAAHRADRRADLVHVAEGLEHEQIDAAFEQRRGLLAEDTPRASSTPVLPQGSMRMPSGPMAPAT